LKKANEQQLKLNQTDMKIPNSKFRI